MDRSGPGRRLRAAGPRAGAGDPEAHREPRAAGRRRPSPTRGPSCWTRTCASAAGGRRGTPASSQSYEASPAVYKASLYFEALKDAIAKSRLYITTDASATCTSASGAPGPRFGRGCGSTRMWAKSRSSEQGIGNRKQGSADRIQIGDTDSDREKNRFAPSVRSVGVRRLVLIVITAVFCGPALLHRHLHGAVHGGRGAHHLRQGRGRGRQEGSRAALQRPYLIQSVTKYDTRLRILQARSETQQTADDRQIIVEAFCTLARHRPAQVLPAASATPASGPSTTTARPRRPSATTFQRPGLHQQVPHVRALHRRRQGHAAGRAFEQQVLGQHEGQRRPDRRPRQ